MSARDTSYEMVCATARRAPKREYFELEDQPEAIKAYTPILTQQRKNRMLRLKVVILKMGREDQTASARNILMMGETTNGT